ncbi:uncharacterized protein LOC124140191 [Haliotis rufescens]|uniref:uncharacterized protein LOC124140191 n=1 Tax=Haliotis rufescens TaxID=6454 RepID=UPI00201EAC3B|nr:uncharacterized protein LOC124140191 [Haliotis rufescens]
MRNLVPRRFRLMRGNLLCFVSGACVVITMLSFFAPLSRSSRDDNHDVLATSLTSTTFSVIKHKDGKWMFDNACETNESFTKTKLHTPTGDTNIFLYPPQQDVWVSGFIWREGKWELDLVDIMHNILKQHPGWIFMDVGANIGVYSVSLAKAGREVIAIEPLATNVKRLCRSLKEGQFEGVVHLIKNAVSDSRRPITLGGMPSNVGGTYIKDVADESADSVKESEQTILLDDLAHVLHGRTVIMKMDIEKHEARALKGGTNFFRLVDVRYLLMEFNTEKQQGDSVKWVVQFLQEHHMVAVKPGNFSHTYDPAKLLDWPSDVMWIKETLTSRN